MERFQIIVIPAFKKCPAIIVFVVCQSSELGREGPYEDWPVETLGL